MAIVLAYHRVGQGDDGWWGMRVSERNFAEQLELLRRDWEPCSLAEALTPPTHLPDRRVAVTFDDGYVDNLTTAAPMMLEAGVPGHLFVATGFMERRQGYWWDALADTRRELFPFDGAEGFDREAFIETWNRLRRSSVDERATLLASLSERTRGSFDLSAEGVLDVDGIRELRRMGMGIGAHSVWHPELTALPLAAAVGELVESRRVLEEILGEAVLDFSYPFGQGSRPLAMVMRLFGFRAGFTAALGAVGGADSPFRLPRVAVGDWDGATLGRVLDFISGEDRQARDGGPDLRIPFELLASSTGRLQFGGVRCEQGVHAAGHCLYGARLRSPVTGRRRFRFLFDDPDPREAPEVTCDVYSSARDRVLATRTVRPGPGEGVLELECLLDEDLDFEPRVYWHGRGSVTVVGMELVEAAGARGRAGRSPMEDARVRA